jgi:hypothetical protein
MHHSVNQNTKKIARIIVLHGGKAQPASVGYGSLAHESGGAIGHILAGAISYSAASS